MNLEKKKKHFNFYFIKFRHGADEMALAAVTPSLVKVLSDPNEKVRETAVNTLVNIYRHVGERFKSDLQRKNIVPQAK